MRWLSASALLTLTSVAQADDQERAEAAVRELASQLRTALVAQMQADGPVATIAFCHDQAPAVAAEVSQRLGVRIGRTSLRTRNASNAPAPWQRAVLSDFAAQAQAGTSVTSLRYATTTDLPAGVALRYMQGIATDAPCLVCHGPSIAEPIAQAINTRYPDDQATAFGTNDLRGAFWVEVPAKAPTAADTTDPRSAVRMSAAQRADLKAQMRAHLESLQATLAALAANDWPAVAAAASTLSPSGGHGQGQMHSFRNALPEAWFSYARPMHQQFAAIAAEAAGQRRGDVALKAVAEATAQCTGCHASFQILAE
jgi:hypothetical protein